MIRIVRAAVLFGWLGALPAAAEDTLLRIWIFEQQHITSARVEVHSGTLSCDGKPTPDFLTRVKVKGDHVELSDGTICARLIAPDASVRLDNKEERRYRGRLEVTVGAGELVVINEVPLEDYVASVVPAEMAEGDAALRAQAVVSRTYALANRRRHGSDVDFCDLTHCQLYVGRNAETKAGNKAVADTKGQVLLTDGKLLPTFFHANCGGATSRPEDVFGEVGAGAAVPEPLERGAPICAQSPDFAWKWSVSRAGLAKALNLKPAGAAVSVTKKDASGRVLALKTFGHSMAAGEFQARVGRFFGFLKLKSMKFTAAEAGGNVSFTGFGLGHGVGMCQQGAQVLSEKGADYREILGHYFPTSKLSTQSPSSPPTSQLR